MLGVAFQLFDNVLVDDLSLDVDALGFGGSEFLLKFDML